MNVTNFIGNKFHSLGTCIYNENLIPVVVGWSQILDRNLYILGGIAFNCFCHFEGHEPDVKEAAKEKSTKAESVESEWLALQRKPELETLPLAVATTTSIPSSSSEGTTLWWIRLQYCTSSIISLANDWWCTNIDFKDVLKKLPRLYDWIYLKICLTNVSRSAKFHLKKLFPPSRNSMRSFTLTLALSLV